MAASNPELADHYLSNDVQDVCEQQLVYRRRQPSGTSARH